MAPESDELTTREALTLDACERCVARGQAEYVSRGEALKTIRDQRLYRLDSPTFETYLWSRFGMSRRSAYRDIGASDVYRQWEEVVGSADVTNLVTSSGAVRRALHAWMPDGTVKTIAVRESVLRPLVPFAAAVREMVLRHLITNTEITSRRRLTARDVNSALVELGL